MYAAIFGADRRHQNSLLCGTQPGGYRGEPFSRRTLMIYELRQYTPNQGKETAMLERFEKTLPLFRKHGLSLEISTKPLEEPQELWYLLKFESESAREAAWSAFLADPEWVELKKNSEVDGPLLKQIRKSILQSR
jgi:hypothetical protein